MNKFYIEDIRSNKEIIEEITNLEAQLKQRLGKEVALIAYTANQDNE